VELPVRGDVPPMRKGGGGCVSGLHPTLRKGAKDGAPEHFGVGQLA
jgi:hypothetical protein